jgi:hypothetical protein
MRELDKGQKVDIAVLADAAKLIREEMQIAEANKIELKHVLGFVEKNQDKEIISQLQLNIQQKMSFVIKGKIRAYLR